MWYVYVLQCKDGSLYTGISTNLETRLGMHNKGKGAKYTRSKRPVQLAYYEAYETKGMALSREIEVKNFSRKSKLELIVHGLGQKVLPRKLLV